MTPVTDPNLLAQLNSTPVTDPALLAQLNGDTPRWNADTVTPAPGSVVHGRYANYTIPQPTQQEAPNALESFGHGMDRTAQGIHQAFLELKEHLAPQTLASQITGKTDAQTNLDRYTQNLNDEEGLYQKGRGPNPGFDWGSLAGSAVASAPLMLLPGGGTTMLGRAGAGMLAGGLDAAAQPTATGNTVDRVKNTGVGVVAGGVLAPAAGYAGDKLVSALNAVRGRLGGAAATVAGNNTAARVLNEVPEISQIDPASKVATGIPGEQMTGAQAQSDLVSEGRKMIAATGKLDSAQLARKANLLANGLQPTAAMVSRDPTQWTIERNLQGLAQSKDPALASTGNELTQIYTGNDAALTKALRDQAAPFGAATQEGRGMTVMSSLDDLARGSQKDVSAVYDAVRDARGADLASDGRNLHETLKDLADSPAADPITQAAKRRMKTLGMLDSEGNLTPNTMTVTQAEGLRQFINKQPNAYGKGEVIRAIDSDVLGGLGEDAFKGARSAAKQRFDMLNNPAAQKALNNFGELSQGRAAQSFIKSQVVSAPDQDVATLLATIDKIPDPQAKQNALNAIRGGVMDHLQGEALNTKSGQFSGSSLADAMQKIGPTKLEAVLGTDGYGRLKSLSQAAIDSTYAPNQARPNYSNTAPAMMAFLEKGRALSGWNLPLGANDMGVQMAARRGYAGQLTDALQAKAAMPEVGIPKSIQKRLASVLAQSAGPLGAQGVYDLRQPRP